MRLSNVRVRNFKSIDDSREVSIEPQVTVLVGQNEAGKTGFLHALEKARPVRKGIKFDIVEDYPRKALNEYRRQHAAKPAEVVSLSYVLEATELEAVRSAFGFPVLRDSNYEIRYYYDGSKSVTLPVDEPGYVNYLLSKAHLPAELAEAAAVMQDLPNLIKTLTESSIQTPGSKELADSLNKTYAEALKATWSSVLAHHVFHKNISEEPKFLFFGDYQLLPGKVNLQALHARVSNPAQLTEEDQTVLRLLRMADVDLKEVMATAGYEEAKARLEGLSNSITDQVFEFWTQNKELDVEFDIRPDPADPTPPFNTGPNLYIRIRNRRHRVTVPFSQRSKGFIWFFSFLVWFDSVKSEETDAPLILLLDEPGLSLHALAQADLLRYIDRLAERHQVLYTTHSPFMVHGDRLHQVRLVEDRTSEGTVVTDNVSGSDPKTLFPLQAALGYTVAQNLFISKRNLLVEGPADLVYLKFVSSALEQAGRTSLREDVTIVPAGGLDKVATFIALLRGNDLDTVVLHDLGTKPDARLESMVRERIIREKNVLNYGMFRASRRELMAGQGGLQPTDIEDLFSTPEYLRLFNGAYARVLGGVALDESDLPSGDRVLSRIERSLATKNLQVRPTGGFNHYLPASFLASNPIDLDAATLARFEELFRAVNGLF